MEMLEHVPWDYNIQADEYKRLCVFRLYETDDIIYRWNDKEGLWEACE